MSPPAPILLALALVSTGAVPRSAPLAQGEKVVRPLDLASRPSWRAIGPAVFGGRIVDLAIVPDDPRTILVASASGGLFRTTNGGTTWECIFQHEEVISIGDIAVDPGDPDVIWVGTGEANNQRSSYWGAGVYRTTDGGGSWTHLGLSETHHIGRIVLDPRDSEVAYVAALGHLYTANPERGLYRTSDGGESWELVLDTGPEVGVVDVIVDPEQPDILYAASYERLRRPWHFDGAGPGSGIWKSEDAGATWRRLEGGLPGGDIGRIGLDIFAGDSRIVYATISDQNLVPDEDEDELDLGFKGEVSAAGWSVKSVSRTSAAGADGLQRKDVILQVNGTKIAGAWDVVSVLAAQEIGDPVELVVERDGVLHFIETTFARRADGSRIERTAREVGGCIYRSEDRGETWTRRNEDSWGGSPAYYYGQIRVDPSDSERIYVLGVPVYLSDDGGRTVTKRNVASSVHVDHHALIIHPDDSDTLLLGNDGGLAISYDRGETWDHYKNIPISQFYAVGVDMAVPYNIYGGTQDNGTWGGPSRSRSSSGIGMHEWRRVGGGDGFYAQIDPRDPNTVYAESQFGALYRRNMATGESRSIRPARTEPRGPRDRYNWNSPILISHHNPEIIYFGGNKLFKSFDRGDTWPVVSVDMTGSDAAKLAGNVPHCTITTIAESPLDPNLLMVGTDDGLVHISEDGGLSWRNLTGLLPGAPAGWWVSRVELSRHDRARAYVSLTGYREDDFRPLVFQTDNLGVGWRPIVGDLPHEPVNVVREDPVNPDLVYVGTELGVYASLGDGAWSALGSGLPTIAVHDLVVHPRDADLVVATHGRGFWVLDVSTLQEVSSEILARDVHLFEVPDGVQWRRSGDSWSGDRLYYGQNPPAGVPVTYHLSRQATEEELSLIVEDSRGERVATLEAPREPGVHRVYWSTGSRGFRRGGGASPGSYSVILELGEERLEQSLELLPDPLLDE